MVLLLAGVLARNQIPGGVSKKGIVLSGIIVMVFSIFVLPNGLTNLIILVGSCLIMFVVGGIKLSQIGLMLVIYVLCGGMAYMVRSASTADKEFDAVGRTATEMEAGAKTSGVTDLGRTGTQKNRIMRHLKGVTPSDTIDDLNRQVILSKFAMAHGGVQGRGPGNSRESACLLVIYLCLIARAGIVASNCTRAFPALLIMGCACLIVLQALIHMAIVTGLAPVSGQPLPFISKGGTSVLVMSAAIGMMLSVSRYGTTKGNRREQRAEMSQLPEDLQASNPMQM